MIACDSLMCPHRADCVLLKLGQVSGDLTPPAVFENPKGCPGSLPSRSIRPSVAAGIEWLRLLAAI